MSRLARQLGNKRCSNCFRIKPLEQFHRKLERHQSRCKACNAEVVASWMARYPRSYRACRNRIYARRKARQAAKASACNSSPILEGTKEATHG